MKNDMKITTGSRRAFLKKAAYAAPAIVALGALNAPVSAHAAASNNIVPMTGNGYQNANQNGQTNRNQAAQTVGVQNRNQNAGTGNGRK